MDNSTTRRMFLSPFMGDGTGWQDLTVCLRVLSRQNATKKALPPRGERAQIQKSLDPKILRSTRNTLMVVFRAELLQECDGLGPGLDALHRPVGHVGRRLSFAGD